jgi:hypothetical protein
MEGMNMIGIRSLGLLLAFYLCSLPVEVMPVSTPVPGSEIYTAKVKFT